MCGFHIERISLGLEACKRESSDHVTADLSGGSGLDRKCKELRLGTQAPHLSSWRQLPERSNASAADRFHPNSRGSGITSMIVIARALNAAPVA